MHLTKEQYDTLIHIIDSGGEMVSDALAGILSEIPIVGPIIGYLSGKALVYIAKTIVNTIPHEADLGIQAVSNENIEKTLEEAKRRVMDLVPIKHVSTMNLPEKNYNNIPLIPIIKPDLGWEEGFVIEPPIMPIDLSKSKIKTKAGAIRLFVL